MEKSRLIHQIEINQEDLDEFLVTSDPDGKMDSIKGENKQLRHQIAALKNQLQQQEKYSQETIDKLYHLKDEEKR